MSDTNVPNTNESDPQDASNNFSVLFSCARDLLESIQLDQKRTKRITRRLERLANGLDAMLAKLDERLPPPAVLNEWLPAGAKLDGLRAAARLNDDAHRKDVLSGVIASLRHKVNGSPEGKTEYAETLVARENELEALRSASKRPSFAGGN